MSILYTVQYILVLYSYSPLFPILPELRFTHPTKAFHTPARSRSQMNPSRLLVRARRHVDSLLRSSQRRRVVLLAAVVFLWLIGTLVALTRADGLRAIHVNRVRCERSRGDSPPVQSCAEQLLNSTTTQLRYPYDLLLKPTQYKI